MNRFQILQLAALKNWINELQAEEIAKKNNKKCSLRAKMPCIVNELT